MATDLTNEQIVTNLLISNGFLKPVNGYRAVKRASNLGEYLTEEQKRQKELQKKSKYTFIDVNSGWNDSFSN